MYEGGSGSGSLCIITENHSSIYKSINIILTK